MDSRGTGPRLSLLVPVYGQLALAMRCVMHLQTTVPEGMAEIIVGDDASPDCDCRDWFTAGLRCQRNPENLGYGGNCNALAAAAQGDILVFINSDAFARPGWCQAVLDCFERHPGSGIVGPKLLFPNGKVQSCGGQYDAGRGPYHRYLGWPGDHRIVGSECAVSWITGAVMATPRSLFHELGGFDAVAYPRAYFEDVDYCERVKAAGREVWYCPEAEFVHLVGQSTVAHTQTPGDAMRHARQFMANSFEFHRRWNEHIVPESTQVYVGY